MPVPVDNLLQVDKIKRNLTSATTGDVEGLFPSDSRTNEIVNYAKLFASSAKKKTFADKFVHLPRRQFILTTQEWIENGRGAIFCSVNPNNVQWTFNMRVADQKTLAGSVQHAWRQNLGVRRRTFFSEPTISITFQSGNIMPVLSKYEARMSKGMENFYQFVDLIGGPRVLDGKNDRRPNVVYITYTSQVYPSIVLTGMFTPEGFSFTDNAKDPNKVEWTANFTVYDSYPRFDDTQQLIQSWRNIPVERYSLAPVQQSGPLNLNKDIGNTDAEIEASKIVSV